MPKVWAIIGWASAFALAVTAPGAAIAEASAVVPPASAETPSLPPLESRDIATRPSPKSPQDLLLPGETLRRRWADPNHPDAPGKPPVAARPAVPSRSAAALPPPVRVTPLPSAPAPVIAAPTAPAKPSPAATVPRKRGQAPAPLLRLDPSPCNGQYFLDGVSVDAMGRPCAGF